MPRHFSMSVVMGVCRNWWSFTIFRYRLDNLVRGVFKDFLTGRSIARYIRLSIL